MHLHNSLSMRPSLGISEEEFHLSLFASVVSLSGHKCIFTMCCFHVTDKIKLKLQRHLTNRQQFSQVREPRAAMF